MQHIDCGDQAHRIDRTKRTAVSSGDDLQYASAAEALERLCVGVDLALLGAMERESHELAHPVGERAQLFPRRPDEHHVTQSPDLLLRISTIPYLE
jgi:hypothetical protein